jgi:ADP-ribose pyrophosphatase YjhB (NUDIX family)
MTIPKPLYCNQCGGALADRQDGTGRLRPGCVRCGRIAYLNPLVLVSTIVMSGDRLLLCKRSDPPAAGKWMLPGGFMECGETLEQAAARELFEETGVELPATELILYSVANLPGINEIYVGFLASVADFLIPAVGAECIDVRFFDEPDIPWSELAYPDVGVYLRLYLSERRSGKRSFHFGSLNANDAISKCFRITDVEDSQWLRPIGNLDP